MTTEKTKATIPLLANTARQALIVRLGGIDCRVRVYYHPSYDSWHADLEVPANNRVVTGKRLTNDTPLLPESHGLIPGNVYCRANSLLDDLLDPIGMGAFGGGVPASQGRTTPGRSTPGRSTHKLTYEY